MNVYRCGLEEGDFSHWTLTGAAGTLPTVVTSPVRSGQYALRANSTGAESWARRDLPSAVTSGTYFTRVYWRMPAYPAVSDDGHRLFVWRSSGAAFGGLVAVETDGRLRLRNIGSTITSTVTTNLDTWYRLEIRHLLSDTAGQLEARLFLGDETTELQAWGFGNFSGGNGADTDTLATNLQQFFLGMNGAGRTWDVYFEDFAINDATGAEDNSWVGPGAEEVYSPDSMLGTQIAGWR
jgi:hypothetical protein